MNSYPRARIAALLALASLSGTASAATITGTVLHATRGEYLAFAEVRVAGTDLAAITERDGSYRLANVPAGTHTLVVTYTGTRPERATVTVDATAAARRDFELTPAIAEASAAGGVQKLDAFVVRSEREGNAKALMEQRRSMNLTNSLSSDVFGDVA
ncbi:MAG: carboxypeptidase-like regulatory domain-containing protein, partial [Opitutaceae bacterium]|nr:carboxypeptidase-like regulatory domain-containing protein [Opitutaceae bacterium]